MKNSNILGLTLCLLIAATILPGQLKSQDLKSNPALDEKLRSFLLTIRGNGTI